MKWHGWGDNNILFPMHEKPTLWPWIRGKVGMKEERKTPALDKAQVAMPPPKLNAPFVSALKAALASDQLTTDDDERLHRVYGKSYPNLFEVRRGRIRQAPDMIVFPRGHDDVVKIIALASEHDVCVIPFGGGTNIVGGVDPMADEERMIVTLDMRQMNKLISIDKHSNIAVIEAGAVGPKMEKDLQAQGFSLGHFPDSFEYSTLGGWVATRSAGMQSDEYGKIEDMVVALKMVTPAGEIVTRAFPACSSGPDMNRILCGSEGVLGVITECTMRVHPTPAYKYYVGFLFKSFEEGTAAMHECVERGFSPSMIRLQDAGETELAFNMKPPKKGFMEKLVNDVMKKVLVKRGYGKPCIMVVGFEGYEDAVLPTQKMAISIFKKHGGFGLGTSVGDSWSKSKFDMPYLRDYVMDYALMCDVSETSATWTNVLPLYTSVIKTIKERFKNEQGGDGYVGCHISHTYKTGACLYFTYAAKQIPGKELEQYYGYKTAITDAIVAAGGTLSHHHAVGYEHMAWMEEELSPTGIESLRALKERLDPKGILNPGKLIPPRAGEVKRVGASKATDAAPEAPRTRLGRSRAVDKATIEV